MKHDSSIHCDELVSLSKSLLTNFVGILSTQKVEELNEALKIALDIPD
jgi:mRNA interferase MazF